MAKLLIDGREYAIPAGSGNLLETCLTLGLQVPYFCWHPALGSVGACRQCAVKVYRDENDKVGRIVMSCMTRAADGTRLSIADDEVERFRAQIIEWLMLNHPHDCPVCDEGGECHLQDMTVMTGHTSRRARHPKRTFENQDLGPLIAHEMNRCIQCYRCVRFYKDYAGGRDLGVSGWHDRLYFGRFQPGTLESPFSGNLVEVCPTGVFTDKSLKARFVRKWDLTTAPSICPHCSLGCNILPGERYGVLRRVRNRYNSAVNGYFLCDRGRYGYDFVNDPSRPRAATLRGSDGKTAEVGEAEALERAAAALRGGRALGIGSPRASLETNYALRDLVGADRFSCGLGRADLELARAALALLQAGPAAPASLREARTSDAVLVLGEDVLGTAPLLALQIRQASRQQGLRDAEAAGIPPWDDSAARTLVQESKGPVIVATPAATGIDDLATETLRAAPADIARFGYAVARELDPAAPEVPALAAGMREQAARVAAALGAAQRPLVVSGTGCRSVAVMEAAAAVAAALSGAGRRSRLSLVLPECNSLGLALMDAGMPLEDALEQVRSGAVGAVIVAENDLLQRCERAAAEELLERPGLVIALDYLDTETTRRADLLLPAAAFAESQGTLVSSEGRAQRFFAVMKPREPARASWQWLTALAAAARGTTDGQGADDLIRRLAAEMPRLARAVEAAPAASFRLGGQKIARQSLRYSGRTALNANVTVFEPKPPEDPDSPLAFSMEGSPAAPPAALIPRFWTPGWNSVQAVQSFQDGVGGPLRGGDPGVLLITPTGGAPRPASPPAAFERRPGQWLLLPWARFVGTEELSARSAPLSSLVPGATIGLAAADAQRLGLSEGGQVLVRAGSASHRLPVEIAQGLACGVALLPLGLPGVAWTETPAWVAVEAAP